MILQKVQAARIEIKKKKNCTGAGFLDQYGYNAQNPLWTDCKRKNSLYGPSHFEGQFPGHVFFFCAWCHVEKQCSQPLQSSSSSQIPCFRSCHFFSSRRIRWRQRVASSRLLSRRCNWRARIASKLAVEWTLLEVRIRKVGDFQLNGKQRQARSHNRCNRGWVR